MQQVRFGIVGVGNMGSAHLSHILRGNVPELKVTAVADINPARLKAAKAAAEKALEWLTPGQVVGVGSGSNVGFFIEALGRHRQDFPRRFLKAGYATQLSSPRRTTTTPRS